MEAIEKKLKKQKKAIIILSITTTLFATMYIIALTASLFFNRTKATIYFAEVSENIYSGPSFKIQITTDKDVIIPYKKFTTRMKDTETGEYHYIVISEMRYYGTNNTDYDKNECFIAYANKINTITIKSNAEPASYKIEENDKYAVFYDQKKLTKGEKLIIKI